MVIFYPNQCKTKPTSIEFSPDGRLMVCMAEDRKVRVFWAATGKLYRVFNETIAYFNDLQNVCLLKLYRVFNETIAYFNDLQNDVFFVFCSYISYLCVDLKRGGGGGLRLIMYA